MLLKVNLITAVMVACNCWQDNFIDDYKEKSFEDYDCNILDGCEYENNDVSIKKKNNGLSVILPNYNGKSFNIHHKPLTCMCGVRGGTVHLKELGEGYSPTRIPSVDCNPKNCGNGHHLCRQRRYTVYVLRRRDAGPPPEKYTPQVPPELRENWVFIGVSVAVGCECGH